MATEGVHDLDIAGSEGIIARWERDLAKLAEHRDQVSTAARGLVGGQHGHVLAARARKLSVAITDMEKVLLTLKDAMGLVQGVGPQNMTGPAPGQPVHGAFSVFVREGVPHAPQEEVRVWPEKPISTLIHEALVLLSLTTVPGTWGLQVVGRGPVEALTVHDAGIESGDVVELVRPSVGDQT